MVQVLLGDEVVAAVHHDPLLAEDVLLLLGVHDVLLLQALQGVRLSFLLGNLKRVFSVKQRTVVT